MQGKRLMEFLCGAKAAKALAPLDEFPGISCENEENSSSVA